ncbi:serine hydrolase [Cylindrospermum sp. FACHB-282]|uniref:serine hydrolase n=1 Tax=Cylindrospermum sp. FACHB-282 TaxID=2692794 RepID=UPI0016856916|nr:serine hydrolase [Cylindrospermum sp. FACHB-282]MBD2385950.1 serine hydrolase [Cylindrospermum sp. FACHB-282]
MNTIPSTGEAWPALEQKVDSLVEALIAKNNLPGMTIAVTKEEKLILLKAYSYALVDGTRKLPMKPCHRSLFGSACKPLVTGAAAFQLMKSKNIDPKSTRLYGPKGFFGGIFDADIDIGIKAHAPESAKWKEWYEKITIQHLLDHKAGFIGSGNVKGAAQMFGVSEDQLTYEQVHRHFLRTTQLYYEPGTAHPKYMPGTQEEFDPYSNQGFGLWTILIPKMSGKSYLDYVREDYLKPMKLLNAVQPGRVNPDSCDAWGHKYDADKKLEALPFMDYKLGLAAGGFRASAETLARLMVELDKKYTTEELDSMGWFNESKRKLGHTGGLGGGTAYVTMFPKGNISSPNVDLSEVHVAILTNIGTKGKDLVSLAEKIALAVPPANVPATFDIWKNGKSDCSCEYVRRGVPANQYQQVFNEAFESGYRLEWIDGYTDDGKVHFNVIFRTNDPAIAWASHHNMTGTTYQQNFDKYRDQGFWLEHVDSYAVGNEVRYAAIWTKSNNAYTAYHGKTQADHQEAFDSLTSQGWKPKVISVASVQGKLFYTALYTKEAIGNFEARSFLTPSEYQTKFDQNTANGRYLHYLNSYVHEGKPRFTAIWASLPKVSGFKANHGLTGDKFQTIWEDALSADFRTQAITGYEDAGNVRFAAYWTK